MAAEDDLKRQGSCGQWSRDNAGFFFRAFTRTIAPNFMDIDRYLTEDACRRLVRVYGYSSKEISAMLVVIHGPNSGCSERSVRRFRERMGLGATTTRDSNLIEWMVREIVSNVSCVPGYSRRSAKRGEPSPHRFSSPFKVGHACGIAAIQSALRSQGWHISYPRIRNSLARVAPVAFANRTEGRNESIPRSPIVAPYPGWTVHIDQNEKLAM